MGTYFDTSHRSIVSRYKRLFMPHHAHPRFVLCFTGEGRLEIRGHGNGSTFLVDLYRGGPRGIRGHHPSGSRPLWHPGRHRRGAVGDRGRHCQAFIWDFGKRQDELLIDPIWSVSIRFDLFWSDLIRIDPIRWNMRRTHGSLYPRLWQEARWVTYRSDPIWSVMIRFDPIWTDLIRIDPIRWNMRRTHIYMEAFIRDFGKRQDKLPIDPI